ncbi:hypothetical protein [Burkholderia glumae]|uniref:hypothetical protein n=1 Tax=Burkholderia glumae TaxID=337 RepID=UPI00054AD930|nr:hypothetical protein [Burkholderia glumae]KHJ64690.1 hypothetical protein NCPPB3923_01570 [Burkholderia glumae]
MTTNQITRADVERRIEGLDGKTQKAVACALLGHSRIITRCLGYVYCGRCQAPIGDTLGSIFEMADKVVIGHGCDTCRTNYGTLDWRDKLLTADPFPNAAEPTRTGG